MSYLVFDGDDDYVEAANSPAFTMGPEGLTVAAWIRPDTLTFPREEPGGYVHFLGKGERGQYEWVFRMYGRDNPVGRENRISFYLFNLGGDQGVGSYFQDPIRAGQWVHVVGSADRNQTRIYRDGVLRDSDVYAGTIIPEHGAAPLRIGTRDFHSFFQGAIGEVRVWQRALTAQEIADLHASGNVPRNGLVAEFVENIVTSGSATAKRGAIVGAACSEETVGSPRPAEVQATANPATTSLSS